MEGGRGVPWPLDLFLFSFRPLSQPEFNLVLTPYPKGVVTEMPVCLPSRLRNLHVIIHEVIFKDNVNYTLRLGELFFFF